MGVKNGIHCIRAVLISLPPSSKNDWGSLLWVCSGDFNTGNLIRPGHGRDWQIDSFLDSVTSPTSEIGSKLRVALKTAEPWCSDAAPVDTPKRGPHFLLCRSHCPAAAEEAAESVDMSECWRLSSERARDKTYRIAVAQGIRSQSTFVCLQLCHVVAMKLCPGSPQCVCP